MAEDSSSLPEESQGKLEQTNAVTVSAVGSWRNSDDMWTFQNYTELEEYGEELALGQDALVVLVIDNGDAELAMYPNDKHYWVIYPLTFETGSTSIYIRHLTEYFSIMLEDGVATMEEINSYEPPGGSFIKLGTYQGYPVLARDPAIDDSRPETQSEKTTGQTNGNTVTTTTTIKPGAAGAVTESTIDPDATEPRVTDQRNTPAVTPSLGGRSSAVETVTAPTTVTRSLSTPTSTNQSSAPPSSSNVYTYESFTPGFDRYDFNTGKKVYTPESGPSRNSSAQPVSPQSTPRVSTTANNLDTAPTRPLPTRPGQTRPDRNPSQLSPGQISGPF